MTRQALLAGLAVLPLCACASDPYTTSARFDCASNLAIAQAANNFASDVERATGRDVDAFDQFDRDVLLISLIGAFASASAQGRAPDADDACAGVNNASDIVFDDIDDDLRSRPYRRY